MNPTLTPNRKFCIVTAFLLLAVIVLSFLPISYADSYHYTDKSYIAECSIIEFQGFLGILYVAALVVSMVLHLLIICGKQNLEKLAFWPIAVALLLFAILCIKILIVHEYVHESYSNYYHDQDGTFGLGLIGGLLVCAGITSACVQFRKNTGA